MQRNCPIKVTFVFCLLFLLVPCVVGAVPTKLVVRAKANDAKFIGTAVGGLKVVVRDALTGKTLAEKTLEGKTGNTKIIMKDPIMRNTVLSQGGAAKAEFVFDIEEPVKLEIELVGPLGAGNNIHKEVKTTWLIPGKDITGDGILFNLYGLIVHAYSPKPHEFFPVGTKVTIGAHITPMCGCPERPDFLWDANKVNAKAAVFFKGKKIAEVPLKWASRISHFEASFVPKEPGDYKIVIMASDLRNNQGIAVTGLVAVPAKTYHRILGK